MLNGNKSSGRIYKGLSTLRNNNLTPVNSQAINDIYHAGRKKRDTIGFHNKLPKIDSGSNSSITTPNRFLTPSYILKSNLINNLDNYKQGNHLARNLQGYSSPQLSAESLTNRYLGQPKVKNRKKTYGVHYDRIPEQDVYKKCSEWINSLPREFSSADSFLGNE